MSGGAGASGAGKAPSRFAVNQWTVRRWGLAEAVDGCVRHGIEAVGLWRERTGPFGIKNAACAVRGAGLRVSSLCRAGFFNRAEPDWMADNRAAIQEAADLGAACLVLVPGGLPAWTRDLAGARARVSDAVGSLAGYAAQCGVRLALEPMHPMYCADRGVVCTLGQALDVVAPHPPGVVGVMVDTFHLWWDPDAPAQIARAGREGRIAGFQVSDFLVPLPADVLLGRAMPGDGVIDFGPLCRAVTAAGYTGDVEVEIFNADVWAADPDDVLDLAKKRFAALISGDLRLSALVIAAGISKHFGISALCLPDVAGIT